MENEQELYKNDMKQTNELINTMKEGIKNLRLLAIGLSILLLFTLALFVFVLLRFYGR